MNGDPRILTWEPGIGGLGRAVIAVGVFDGVHLGHQALLRAAVADAHQHLARSVALTFDRDPDQVVVPEASAPQLLTLADKCRFILEADIDLVLVVPFTSAIAATDAEDFLDDVILACCEPLSVHVGHDFRFGARARGDVDTLYVWGVEHGVEVEAHRLLEIGDEPVTSTRIRRLVADGSVSEAAALLGRPTRLTGTVHRGREEGAALGFPTANVVPVAHAAVPGDGVYAGFAHLDEGSVVAAAISVGVPPTFPQAKDHVEAHLLGFEGDLYGAEITLEFVERVRSQEAYGSRAALTAAIAADVAEVERITSEALPYPDYVDDDAVEDPLALEAAERAVAGLDPLAAYDGSDEPWVELAGPMRLSGLFSDAGFTAALATAPLEVASIPYAWDPYPPEMMTSYRPYYGVFDRPFTLLVPASRLPEAQRVFGQLEREVDRASSHQDSRASAAPMEAGPGEGGGAGSGGSDQVDEEPVFSAATVGRALVSIAIVVGLLWLLRHLA